MIQKFLKSPRDTTKMSCIIPIKFGKSGCFNDPNHQNKAVLSLDTLNTNGIKCNEKPISVNGYRGEN